MKKQSITIRDVARQAGVGISTVSRVLNGYALVKEETRQRILAVCRDLNYIPNDAARMLVKDTAYRNTVAVLMPVVAHQYFFELISSLQQGLRQHEVNTMIFNTDHGHESKIHFIIGMRISAVLILGDNPLSTSERDLLKLHNIPYLFVDRVDEEAHYLCFDNQSGGQQAAEYLMKQGCRSIMLVGIVEKTQQQQGRFSAFRRAVAEMDPTIEVNEVFVADEAGAYSIATRLMRDPGIDGYFFFSDLMAYGGLQARQETGFDGPIVGYDDIFPSRYMQLTTVSQSAAQLGAHAVEVAVRIMQQHSDVDSIRLVQQLYEPSLIIRST